jgi:TolB-like protein
MKSLSATILAVAIAASATTAFAAELPKGSRVVVIPFHTLNVPAEQQWIGKAVQDTLMADLGKQYTAVAFEGQTIVEDNATALRVAREASAPYVVRGSAHVVNGEVRLTAQLLDAKTGETVNTAIATGPVNNLLTMEDDIAAQIQGIPALVGPIAPAKPVAPQAPLPPAYSTQQVTTFNTPATVYRVHEPYPPAPFNDISLSAQNYNTPAYTPAYYPSDYYPVYSTPIYYYPPVYTAPYYSSYCPPFYSGGIHFSIGSRFHGGFRGGFNHGGFNHGGFRGGFRGIPNHGFISVGGYRGGFNSGGYRGGFNSGGFRGGFSSGGFRGNGGGGFHGGGFGGGHGHR